MPHRSWLSAIKTGVAAAALAISTASFTLPSASAATSGWRTVPGPAVPAGASANLTGLTMAGPSLGWASGFTLASPDAPFEPLLAAWNGRHWRTIPVHLGTGVAGRLDGLAVSSATDAWAVGTAYPDSQSAQPLILHWDGQKWARVPGAGVPGYGYVMLLGVAVRSATDAWAVGEAESATTAALRPVIEHWDDDDQLGARAGRWQARSPAVPFADPAGAHSP